MEFSIKLPLISDYFTTVRLTVSGICAQAGLDIDETEDFKVCVTESLLILKRNGAKSAEISFDLNEGITATVRGVASEVNTENPEDDISYALLGALIDDVQFMKYDDNLVEIILFKS